LGDLYVKYSNTEKWIISSGIVAHTFENSDFESEMIVFAVNKFTGDHISQIIPNNASISINEEAHASGGIFSLIAEANLLNNKNWVFTGTKLENKFVQKKWPREKLLQHYKEV